MAEERVDIPPEDEAPKGGEAPKRDKRTAIAMRYDVDKDRAPLVLASGRGPVADEILRIAEENKIPLYEDRELASLLAKLELDTEIPPELYVLVAEVLFFVYKLDKMAEKKERVFKRMKEEEKERKRGGK
jgi:flagellar biosynthesis protein